MSVLEIKIKSFPSQAAILVDIWDLHVKSKLSAEYILFESTAPEKAENNKRLIRGFEAESVCYLKNGRELIKMSMENFIYLMAESGVDIDIQTLSEQQ